MKNCPTSRSTAFFALVAIAAIGLACSASTSHADITKSDIMKMLMQRGEVSQAGTPRQVLPAISNPRPLRQGLLVNCNVNTMLGANTCIMAFDVVPAGRLVQIDKMNCISPNGSAVLFNTEIKVNGNRILGFTQPPIEGTTGGVATGPFYLKAGERPLLAATAAVPTETAICTISGTLWQAS
jgi:hypothetical protein